MEGDLTCAVKWVSGRCSAPWRIADTVEEVLNLAKVLDVPFVQVKTYEDCKLRSRCLSKGSGFSAVFVD